MANLPPPPPVPIPPPPAPGWSPRMPVARPLIHELPGGYPIARLNRPNVPTRLYPHSPQRWHSGAECPATHIRPARERPIYSCYVIRREPSASSKRLSWKNPPHISRRSINANEFDQMKKANRKSGGPESVEMQYDRLKHGSMRNAVDFVIEACDGQEQAFNPAPQWIWRLVLVHIEQRCIGNPLLPTKFQTYQIRVVLQRVSSSEETSAYAQQYRANGMSSAYAQQYPGPYLQQQFPYSHNIQYSHGYPALDHGQSPHYPEYYQDRAANATRRLTGAEPKDDSMSDRGSSTDGKKQSSSKADNPIKKPKQLTNDAATAKYIKQLLASHSSDSDSEGEENANTVKHRRTASKPKANSHPDDELPAQWDGPRRRYPRARQSWTDDQSFSDRDNDSERGTGYETPPTSISDDGSIVYDGYEHRGDDVRSQPRNHRYESRQQYASNMGPRDFSKAPRHPQGHEDWAPGTGNARHRVPETEARLAYIAAVEKTRQLRHQRDYRGPPHK